MKLDTAPDAWVVVPATGVSVATFIGLPLQSWILWLNLVLVLLAIGWKLWTIYKGVKNGSK